MTKTYTNFDNNYDPSALMNDATNSIGFVNAVNTATLCGCPVCR